MAVVFKKPTPLNHDPLDVLEELGLLIHQYKEQVALLFASGAKPAEINAAVRTLGILYKQYADIEHDLGRPKKMPTKISPKYEEPIYSPIRDQILYNMEYSEKLKESEKKFFEILATDYGEEERASPEKLKETEKEFFRLMELAENPGIEPETLYPPPLENPENKKYLSH